MLFRSGRPAPPRPRRPRTAPIEERAAAEVLRPLGVQAAPEKARAYNPAFDVTPARLITAIITERGIVAANRSALAALFPELAS